MKAISASQTKCITQKTRLFCTDNSGAKELEVISVIGHKSRRRMNPKAGIADMINIVVKKGKPEIRKKVERAVVVRTKKEYQRPDGTRIKFEDNAAVIVDDKGVPKGSEIKGVVAKEAAERWPKIAGLAQQVI